MAHVVLTAGLASGKKRYGKLAKAGAYTPLYGLLMLAAVLERKGHRVTLIEREGSNTTDEDIVELIRRERPDLVGLSVFTIALDETLALARAIKQACDVPIVAGGPHVTLEADGLKPQGCFDYMVRGEAEETLVELIEAVENGGMSGPIAGLLYRQDGEWIDGGQRPPILELDKLPFPAFHKLEDISRYHPTCFGYRKQPHLPVVTSRGCPFKCIFCANVWGRKWRAHSAEYVLELITHMNRALGAKEVWFVEDTFAVDRQRVVDICEGILSRRLKLTWSCMTNLHFMDRELVRLMKRAGCWQMQLGLESGNNEVLRFIRKPITTELVREKVNMIYAEGIRVRGYFILGHLIDTRETIEQTIGFALSLPLYTAEFHLMVLSMGSEARRIAHQYGHANCDLSVMSGYRDQGLSFVPRGLTEAEMFEYQRQAHNRFFLRPKVIARLLGDIRGWTDLKRYWLMGQTFMASVPWAIASRVRSRILAPGRGGTALPRITTAGATGS